MKYFIYALAVCFLVAGSVFGGDLVERPLKDFKLDFDKVGCERLTYAVHMQTAKNYEKDLGDVLVEAMVNAFGRMAIELEVKVSDDDVNVYHKMSMRNGFAEYSTVCDKNIFLSPRVSTVRAGRGDEISEAQIIYNSGQAVYEVDGKKMPPKDFPADTVVFMHLFRVVPQLPQEVGVKYTFENHCGFNGSRAVKAQPGEGFGITYSGQKAIEVKDKEYKLSRYDLVGDRHKPQFFVNAKGQVQFVRTKGFLMVLLTPEEVEKLAADRIEKEKKAEAERKLRLDDIHDRSQWGKIEDMKRILDKDPSQVNKKNDRGETPLHKAVGTGKIEAMELLIERGADISTVDNSGETCLHKTRDPETIEYLIAKKPELMTVKNDFGRTPLIAIVMTGYGKGTVAKGIKLADLFFTKMAETENITELATDTLFVAANSNNLEMAKYFIGKGADVNYSNKYGKSVIYKFEYRGNVEAVKYLIEKGANVNVKDVNKKCLLHELHKNAVEIAKVLIDAGADVNAKDFSDQTALHEYAVRDEKVMVELLLENGADINANGNSGTPLYYVAKHGKIDMLKLLVQRGADINAVDKNGRTCLHVADGKEKIKYLAGQAPELMVVEDKFGHIPFMSMIGAGKVENVDALFSEMADYENISDIVTEALLAATYQLECVKYLVSKGADIDFGSKSGLTALYMFGSRGDVEAVKYFIENGAKVNVQNKTNNEWLLHDLRANTVEVAQLLIDAGADVNAKGIRDQTALHVYAANGDKEMVELLLKHGADVNATNKSGTPLDVAVKNKHQEIVELLKKD
jgi:ankyrin repeat protein